eukprot:CAMPEP_0195518944 /NCGR_PEP_ID=MMETSP0794_2-20130614/14015_1 /TAXON_ID=515487 /ORGANISM="Stephanopyxis turris, Strain CCMP 815" /LENGTH=282 /DNA_ID=CAMNT_0040647999 /DNA_START=123 /DNA_END=971 /DNA_ORIENTATION=+
MLIAVSTSRGCTSFVSKRPVSSPVGCIRKYASLCNKVPIRNNNICPNPILGFLNRRIDTTSDAATKSFAPSGVNTYSTRLFGTKLGSGIEGNVVVSNEQTALPNLDVHKVEVAIRAIRDILGYNTFDVALVLTDDDEIRKMNRETREIDKSTDILSFPLYDNIETPGKLPPPEFDIPDFYFLGDMMLSVPYVIRRCEEDAHDLTAGILSEDRGVSGAMASELDPEKRIPMLLVHGMLHLVGYDHIDDDDYEEMVTREEDVIRLLNEKMQLMESSEGRDVKWL